MLKKNILLSLCILALSGCSTTGGDLEPYEGYEDDYTVYEDEASEAVSIKNEATLKEATEQVVMDIRGKKNAQSYMNFQKPIVQCGIMIPGRIVGSSMIPPQEGCVVMAPGAFIDSSTLRLPLEGSGNE
jgi:hypothetical protein